MTEEDWLAGAKLTRMLTYLELGDRASNRKLRLFAVACCRRIWLGLRDERSRKAVETAERFADGLATPSELRVAFLTAYAAVDDCLDYSPFSEDQAIAAYLSAARHITESDETVPEVEDAHEVVSHVWSYAVDESGEAELQQCHSLRDIFGNPFRPITFNPAWRTSDVMILAQGIYDERAFDWMPILADALQDAGCDNDDILNHCRDASTPHARGCWVVDLILGKS